MGPKGLPRSLLTTPRHYRFLSGFVFSPKLLQSKEIVNEHRTDRIFEPEMPVLPLLHVVTYPTSPDFLQKPKVRRLFGSAAFAARALRSAVASPTHTHTQQSLVCPVENLCTYRISKSRCNLKNQELN